MPEDNTVETGPNHELLLNTFRSYYHHYVNSIREAVANNADSIVLARLGDQVDEFAALLTQMRIYCIFLSRKLS